MGNKPLESKDLYHLSSIPVPPHKPEMTTTQTHTNSENLGEEGLLHPHEGYLAGNPACSLDKARINVVRSWESTTLTNRI